MSSSVEEQSSRTQGTLLLEEYENCLPQFNILAEQQHLQFVKAIHMLSDHFKLSDDILEYETIAEAQPIIHRLRQLHDHFRGNNNVIASAIRVTMLYIESYYLNDRDAKFLHTLTSLHIHSPITWLERPPNW